MKPGGGRLKGAVFERALADILRQLYPEARRGLGQARGGGECADVEGTPFWVQAKHGARPNIAGAYDQAVYDRLDAGTVEQPDTRPIIVVTRRDRGPTLVTMHLDDWLEVLRHGGPGRSVGSLPSVPGQGAVPRVASSDGLPEASDAAGHLTRGEGDR